MSVYVNLNHTFQTAILICVVESNLPVRILCPSLSVQIILYHRVHYSNFIGGLTCEQKALFITNI